MQLYKDKWASFEELPNFRVVYLCPPWESMCGIWWRAPVPHRREGYQPPRFAVSFQLITSILHSHTIIPFWGRGSFICKDCSSFRRNFSAYIPTCTTWQNFYLLVDTPFVLFELLIKRWKLENQNLEIHYVYFIYLWILFLVTLNTNHAFKIFSNIFSIFWRKVAAHGTCEM